MTPSPHPSTSCLRPLNPTTSHNNNNNDNNGRLHACVCATKDIEPFLQPTRLVVECESQQQFDLIIGPHKRFWFPCTSHFRLLLVVFGFFPYCLFVYNVRASLLLRLWWISSATYRPGICTTAFLAHPCGRKYSWNEAEDVRGKKDCFHTCGQGLKQWPAEKET